MVRVRPSRRPRWPSPPTTTVDRDRHPYGRAGVVSGGEVGKRLIERGKRRAPEPVDPQPKAREHGRRVDAVVAYGLELIPAVVPKDVEERALTRLVQEPVLPNTGRFIFLQLLVAVTGFALRRDDLDHQISRSIEVRPGDAVG